ncbi:MAG: hypothetical protein RIR51_228 [Bacteroidota bacterium]|jgi:DNA-binding transcriptional MerR regulator
MISIEECKKILNKNREQKLSIQQVEQIRAQLYELSEIIYQLNQSENEEPTSRQNGYSIPEG